jgi:two-component system, LytTR family, sensor kinase
MKPPSLRGVARAYLLAIAFWFGFALLMGLQYRTIDVHRFWSSLGGLLLEVALRGLAFALWSPPIFYLVRAHLGDSRGRFHYVLLWSLGVVPFLALQTTLLWVVVPPNEILEGSVARSFHSWVFVIRNGFADQVFIYVAVVVAAHAYEYLRRLRREERERYEYQQALAASELQALKMQLQPHFLFNTLHGIATLVDGDPQSAKAMIVKLSNLLRAALDRDGSDLISFQDELRFAREYLDLEKMRFGDRLKVEWGVSPEVSRVLVPQMMLQPLLENAIRHGVASAREGGWIEITASAADGILTVRLRNSAGGRAQNGTGVGLRNVEARLKYLYAGDASLCLTFAGDGTATVTASLPALNSRPAPASEDLKAAMKRRDNRAVHEEDDYASSRRG